jgi:hypothetical protein
MQLCAARENITIKTQVNVHVYFSEWKQYNFTFTTDLQKHSAASSDMDTYFKG